jgi:hypothetical protein
MKFRRRAFDGFLRVKYDGGFTSRSFHRNLVMCFAQTYLRSTAVSKGWESYADCADASRVKCVSNFKEFVPGMQVGRTYGG